MHYPYSVPLNIKYPEEEYATLHNNPGNSCSSTVCSSVYYSLEGNEPKWDCIKSECDCSTKRTKSEFENNSGCICNSENKRKNSNCNCNKSSCGCNSESRRNKQKYDCESCRNDYCNSRSECVTRDCECGRYSDFEKPMHAKYEQKKSRCGSSKCGCDEPKYCKNSDAILDSLRVVDELLKQLLQ